MNGLWVYRREQFELDVSKGDCWNCTFAGTVSATYSAPDDQAEWECPSCTRWNYTDIPT